MNAMSTAASSASVVDTLLGLVLVTNFALLWSSSLVACVRLVALQGVLLGLFAMATHPPGPMSFNTLLITFGGMALKGFLFPFLLLRAIKRVRIRGEIEPFVGHGISVILGIGVLAMSFWVSSRLPLPSRSASTLILPGGFFTVLVGCFIVVSRSKALTQVLGYLVLENGIYALGAALLHREAVLVELGVLLDLFVAIFVMAITIFQIHREFDHVDTRRLSTLRE